MKKFFGQSTDSSPGTSPDSSSERRTCQAHTKLNEWQIRQYRRAIDENKWYMSERTGRAVSWEEAEHDFLHNGYYGCAPKWRKEYCAHRCSFFSNCALGHLFTKQ